MITIPGQPSPLCIAYVVGGPDREVPDTIQRFSGILTCSDLSGSGSAPIVSWPDYAGLIVCGSTGDVGDPSSANGFERDPEIPVELDGQLCDEEAREQFLDRAIGYRDVRDLFREGWRIPDLVAFNVRERFRIIGHDPKKHKLIGRLVAKAKDHPREFLEREIPSLFLTALARPMTRRKHVHVLDHVAEFVAPGLDVRSRDELTDAIASYGSGLAPRNTVLCLLRKHVEDAGIAGLRAQSYLYPDEVLQRFLERA